MKSPLQKLTLALVVFLFLYFGWKTPRPSLKPPTPRLSGQILDLGFYGSTTVLEVKTALGKGRLLAPFKVSHCLPGNLFEAVVLPDSQGYLNLFDTPKYLRLKARGYDFSFRLRDEKSLRCFENPEASFIDRLRARLFEFAFHLSPSARGLFTALVLGEKGPLPEEFKEKLRTQGLYHFLAVSGFHLGIIYGLIYFVVKRLGAGILGWRGVQGVPAQVPALVVALLGAGIYALLSGGSPSAQRALLMLTLFTASRIFFLKTSGFDLLAGTVLITLLFQPETLFSLSFQLSVSAVLGILIAHRLFPGILRFSKPYLRYPAEGFWISLGASLATLPFLLWNFGQASLSSPLNTILVSPLWCGILIPGEILVAGLVFIHPELASKLAEFLGRLLEEALKGPLPELILHSPYPVGLFLLTLLFLGLSLYFLLRKRYRPALVCLLLAGLGLGSGLWVRYRFFYLVVFDIGKGNAVLAHLPGDQNLLFDAGARYGEADLGKRILVPGLFKLGLKTIKAVIVSHPDLDHVGGLPALEQNLRIHYLISGDFQAGKWKKLGLTSEITVVRFPTALRISPAEIFLFPGKPRSRELNRESLVAYLEYRGLTVFFPGDIDSRRLERLFRNHGFIPSEIFILPHHGARSGYFAPAWKALNFKVAIASARGRWHPHPFIVNILESEKHPWHLTAKEGALAVFLRKDRFWVCSTKDLKGALPWELLWPYIPYLNGKGCAEYELHTLRDL